MAPPAYLAEARQLSLAPSERRRPRRDIPGACWRRRACSKRWVCRQYRPHGADEHACEHRNGGRRGARQGHAPRAGALGRWQRPVCLSRSLRRAQLAVAEAARNVACAGGQPIGATNCLNFGNPERPEIMWQFARAGGRHRHSRVARSTSRLPGANVSLYNETDGKAICPRRGAWRRRMIEDAASVVRRAFRREGDANRVLGETRERAWGSEYLKVVHGLVRGVPLAGSRARGRAAAAAGQGCLAALFDRQHDLLRRGLRGLPRGMLLDTGVGADVDIPAVDAAVLDSGTTCGLVSPIGVARHRFD